jgi:hypothetical protein
LKLKLPRENNPNSTHCKSNAYGGTINLGSWVIEYCSQLVKDMIKLIIAGVFINLAKLNSSKSSFA